MPLRYHFYLLSNSYQITQINLAYSINPKNLPKGYALCSKYIYQICKCAVSTIPYPQPLNDPDEIWHGVADLWSASSC